MHRVLIAIVIALLVVLAFKAAADNGMGVDDGDTMRFVYYAMLAVLVGSGVLASQRNLSQAAKNLGLWALIALVLVVGYVYRGDMQDVASRVTAGLVPGRAASVVDENGFNTVILYRAQNGHFGADATVNGHTVPMMVDTGASTIALTYEDAEKLGLAPQTLDFSSMVMTANGPARTAYVTLPQISIGGIERTNVRAGIAERGKMDQSLLGMNFLETLSSFAFAGDELRLRD